MAKLVIGIGDMKVSQNPDDTLITYALGSCLGVVVFDPQVRVGGLIHIALPESTIMSSHEEFNPLKFVDTGIPLLFKEMYKFGAVKQRIKVKLVGCSQIADEAGFFNIGKRNYAAARKLLWKNNVLVEAEDCGESVSRTVSLDIGSGRVLIRSGGQEKAI